MSARPRLGLDPPCYGWRTVGWLLLGCMAATVAIYVTL